MATIVNLVKTPNRPESMTVSQPYRVPVFGHLVKFRVAIQSVHFFWCHPMDDAIGHGLRVMMLEPKIAHPSKIG